MSVAEREEQTARDAILKILSNEEISRVSAAESQKLAYGQEYLDLKRLDRGIQRAGENAQIEMGHILPRNAVSDQTWSKILTQLANRSRKDAPRANGRVSRLFRNRGFVAHFIVYGAVNALLIAINLMTTPGKYWFYFPLLGWGIGIIAHACAVLRRPRIYFLTERRWARKP